MARRLKTYQTSVGFFDLAIAAPSMKAAAEAWGTKTEDFRRGFARQTDDPEIVAATIAKPGVVLKRPVASKGPFTEHARLPKRLREKNAGESAKPQRKTARPPRTGDDEAAREAALAFEQEQKRRERARQKEEVAREKERKRREQAVAKAERTLEQASRQHEAEIKKLEQQRAKINKRFQSEEARWAKQKEKMEAVLRRARE